ncbi:MAG: hypothetical protein ACHQIK_17155 [Candidatus Acidiferrales bacterium]
MSDVFGQIHAEMQQRQPQPGGADIFSQIHAENQTMAPGSYQSRKGGPVLNANDSALRAGVQGVQNALGVTKPPSSLLDEFSQIGSSLKQFGVKSWDELQKATREEGGTPVIGTPFTTALYVPHVIARGIEGIASNIESGSSDIEAGIQHKDLRSAAYGIGVLTGLKAQITGGEKLGDAIEQAKNASRLQAPLGDTMTTPGGTIPPEAYTPEQLKAYADQNGISLNAAQATGHSLPRTLQSAGERAMIGGTAVKSQIAASQASLATHVDNLADQFSPKTPDVGTAGQALKTSVTNALDVQLTKADANYAKVDAAAQGTTVDLTPVKDTATRILGDTGILQKAGLDPKTATRVLNGIGNLDDAASFTDAQKLRSALLDLSRSPELAISTTAQGMLKQVIGSTDTAMMEAASETPELQKAFRDANTHYEKIQNDFNSPRSPMNQILSEPDPNKVPQKLTAKGQTGGSPYNPQLLDSYGIDKAPLKRVILDDLYGRDFRLQGKTLGGYSDDFLRSVFDKPGEIDDIYQTGAIARRLGLNTNPSGTAAVSAAIEQTAKPVKALMQTVPAYLTNASYFNRWLMQVKGSGGYRGLAQLFEAGAAGRQKDQEQ